MGMEQPKKIELTPLNEPVENNMETNKPHLISDSELVPFDQSNESDKKSQKSSTFRPDLVEAHKKERKEQRLRVVGDYEPLNRNDTVEQIQIKLADYWDDIIEDLTNPNKLSVEVAKDLEHVLDAQKDKTLKFIAEQIFEALEYGQYGYEGDKGSKKIKDLLTGAIAGLEGKYSSGRGRMVKEKREKGKEEFFVETSEMARSDKPERRVSL